MKVYEMSFRDMDQKMVEIHGVKMVKLLEKMGLKLDNLYGALMYGYIDHNAGFIFEIVALETKKRNIELCRLVYLVRFLVLMCRKWIFKSWIM